MALRDMVHEIRGELTGLRASMSRVEVQVRQSNSPTNIDSVNAEKTNIAGGNVMTKEIAGKEVPDERSTRDS